MNLKEEAPSGQRLLIADDEPNLRRLVELILKQRGHEVVAVEDGLQALDTALDGDFDGIILDINMPHMTGIEVLQRLRLDPRTRDTKVVLLTSLSSEDEVNEGLWHGASLYLTKPVDPQALALAFP